MASTRLPGKPLADIAGEPMIVHVMRRAQAAQLGRGRGCDRFRGDRSLRREGRRPRGDDPRRSRSRARTAFSRRWRRPTRSGAPTSSSTCRATCRRSPRPTSPPRSTRSPIRPSTSARWRPRSAERRSARNPNVVKVVGTPVAERSACARSISPAPPRPAGDGPALSSHRALRLSPRGARALRRACRPRRSSRASSSSSCARSRPACASTSTIVDSVPLGVDTPEDLERARAILAPPVDLDPASAAYRNGHDPSQEDRLPGRAGREFAPRRARGLSGLRAGAVRDLRGCLRRHQQRRGRARHDPDRELGRRPRRRHPPPDAALGAAHHRRAFHAGAASAAGAAGRDARGHQDGREPRPRARPVPQDHPQARHQADRRRRHRGLGARGRRSRRQDARRHRHAARRRDLRPRHPGARTSRTRPTTPRASSCSRATRDGRRTTTAR